MDCCDVFCATCGAEIDRLTMMREERDNGLAQSMLLGDSLRDHRKATDCDGSRGWRLGEWVASPAPEPAK